MAAKQTRNDAKTTIRRENIENKVAVTSSQKYADSFQCHLKVNGKLKSAHPLKPLRNKKS